MQSVTVHPIGVVRSPRTDLRDDFWGDVEASIVLADHVPTKSLDGLDEFSHAEILFLFDRVTDEEIVTETRHPRGNPAWPRVGVFAQRGKARPNRIGATIVEIVGRDDRTLRVRGLDAADGTPVLDIKPVFAEFLPRSPVRQPAWAGELMRDYWRADE
jgi:tRNA-Thr(GGU) m(6)t(6)A37 methyltransferase TsaA